MWVGAIQSVADKLKEKKELQNMASSKGDALEERHKVNLTNAISKHRWSSLLLEIRRLCYAESTGQRHVRKGESLAMKTTSIFDALLPYRSCLEKTKKRTNSSL